MRGAKSLLPNKFLLSFKEEGKTEQTAKQTKSRVMSKLSTRLLCQIYLLSILLAVTTLSPLPYSPLALILLLVVLFTTFRPLQPRLSIAILVATIFLLPLILEPFLRSPAYTPLLSLATLPVLYLLDYNLKQNSQNMTLVHNIKGRHITTLPNALFVSILAILLASLILNNLVLLFTSLILILYLLVILIRVLLAIPRLPLDVPATWKRIVAGTTANISLYATSKVSMPLHCLLSPVDSWVDTPQRFTLNGAKIELNLTITPPLAGPMHPQLQLSIIDPWGFIQINQAIEPVEVHVIPRARYAEWLAIKYLEQMGAGTTTASTLSPKNAATPQRGIEYFDSRIYQPGDELRDIDWKHTLKLSQLIIKQHIEAGEQAAIIAVNLSVADVEEADKLAFNLITTALTLARETIPTTLVAYNHERVTLTTAVPDPTETLKQALLLTKDITPVEFAHRFLQPPDITKLRRNMTLLKQVTSRAGRLLLSMLDFEYRAMEEAAKRHPATLALSWTTRHVPPPAIIVLVSQLNHDAEALLVTSEKLSKRGFTTISVEAAKSNYSLPLAKACLTASS